MNILKNTVLKEKLELDILKLVSAFEVETNLLIDDINLISKEMQSGNIINIDVGVNIKFKK